MHLNRKFRGHHRQSFALIATLALLAVATILLVLFVSTTTLDRSASYTYSQSVKADQIGLGGLHLVVSQLQAEMYKDALPDTVAGTYPNMPIFTNVAGSNILPQADATNASLPSLVKMSTNTLFFSGGVNTTASYRNGMPMATTVSSTPASSTTPSLNGRSVSTNVWNQIYLGQYPSSTTAPYWVVMTRGGAAGATTLATLKDPTIGNTGYAVGRIAFAVYDEGSLLDINAAGYPTTISPGTATFNQIKGSLAGADLSQIPGITASSLPTFISWRNAASAQATNTFVSYVTSFASSNGFQQVYPGDSAFISRQDLIRAAQTGGEGLTTAALPYLATFTRELNAPSWAPSVTVPAATATKYTYAKNATLLTGSPFTTGTGRQNPNPMIPFVRYANAGTVKHYKSDGSGPFTYTVNKGDSVVQYRFPLDRLNWITPKGPSALLPTTDPFYNAGGTVAAIQSCFGLFFGTGENLQADPNWTGISVWKYVGSVGTATSATTEKAATLLPVTTAIETLSDIAAEASPREPNFFELLQAGVLSGSVALDPGSASAMQDSGENYATLQLFRIGANMIAQVQPQAYPINIEYEQGTPNFSAIASGIANLPYFNMLKFVTGQNPTETPGGNASGAHQMSAFGFFGLWNPHQQPNPVTAITRPTIALFLQGSISVGSGWAKGTTGSGATPMEPLATSVPPNAVYGSSNTLPANTFVTLSNGAGVGANGFLNPYPITALDISASSGTGGSSSAQGWVSPSLATFVTSTDPEYTYLHAKSTSFELYEIPDLYINLALGAQGPGIGTGPDATHDVIFLGNTPVNTGLSKFQAMMKYQNPVSTDTGTWVPYDYWIGYNYTGAGATGSWPQAEGLRDCYYGPPGSPSPPVVATTAPPTLHDVLHSVTGHSTVYYTTDPRTMRFGTFPLDGDTDPTLHLGSISNPVIESLWSGTTSGAVNPNTSAPFNVTGYASGNNAAIPGEGGTYPAVFTTGNSTPAHLSRNNLANTSGGTSAGGYFTAYPDLDGIQRIADSGLFATSLPFAAPPIIGNPYFDPSDTPAISGQRTADRPIILNRPFSSVGELGYVFRDAPWRTLDFSSVSTVGTMNGLSTSPDSGLLDLFTVTDSPNNVVAGRVNLNRASSTVLTAILNGTTANVGDTANNTSVSTMGSASAIATALATFTSGANAGTGPLVNKDQLATKFSPALPIGTATTSTVATTAPFANSDEQDVKAYREAYIRALADVGQTRTWNLLIDLVAQAGKYPSSAADLTQFEVEGERHYWLHIAIDRFTGKVIDRQLELIGP